MQNSTATGTKRHASFPKQCIILTRRSFLNMHRDMGYYWLRFFIYVGLAITLGTIFYNVGSTNSVQVKLYIYIYRVLLDLDKDKILDYGQYVQLETNLKPTLLMVSGKRLTAHVCGHIPEFHNNWWVFFPCGGHEGTNIYICMTYECIIFPVTLV